MTLTKRHSAILGEQTPFSKLERAMDHLNREHLPYNQQDIGDRLARFALQAAIERLGEPCQCSECLSRPGRSRKSTFDLYWSPEGRIIATVQAVTMRQAIRKAPMPYRRYLGEIYAVLVSE